MNKVKAIFMSIGMAIACIFLLSGISACADLISLESDKDGDESNDDDDDDDNDDDYDKSDYLDYGFETAEEFLDNPYISNAIDEAGVEIHLGDDPPTIEGEYQGNGATDDASWYYINSLGSWSTTECILNQTSSGSIDWWELYNSITHYGTGGLITGESNNFSIWLESDQEGTEDGYSEGCELHISLIMSGSQETSGDLLLQGISILTSVENCSDTFGYSDEEMVGTWWKWEGEFTLTGECE